MNGDPKPETNKGIIMWVVATLSACATIGFLTLSYCLIAKIQPDQVLLTAFISMTTGVTGVIGGMLTKTSPTETTKHINVGDGPVVTDTTEKPNEKTDPTNPRV